MSLRIRIILKIEKAGTVHATEITCLCHKNVMKTRMLNILYRHLRRFPIFDLLDNDLSNLFSSNRILKWIELVQYQQSLRACAKRIPLICIKRRMWNFEAKMRNFLHLIWTSSVSIRRHFLCCWIQKPPSFRTWCKFIHPECVLFSILQWLNWLLVQCNSICDIRNLIIFMEYVSYFCS